MNSKSHILIVDDIVENIQILLEILYSDSYLFAFATNAEEAFLAIENQKPDIILLDIMMPGTNGYEVCSVLKKNPNTNDIPVIFLSAKSELHDKLYGFQVGAIDYITKPYENEDVIARVRTHLQLKKAIDENKELVAKLEELNATKDKFFSIISHDLKNPFSVLINFSDLLQKNYFRYDDEKKLNFIQIINDTSKRSYSLLQNLLEWSRSQTGRIPFNPEKFSISYLINHVLSLLENMATNKQITIKTQIDTAQTVFADINMIETVLRNLITNAIKFTPTNGSISIISYTKSDAIQITVQDTGIGISPEIQKKLFNLETGISSTGTNDEKGTGLGLILCKEFVEKNNGKIWLQSEKDKGSEFSFTLPLA